MTGVSLFSGCKTNADSASTGNGGGSAGGGGVAPFASVGTVNSLGFYVQPVVANTNIKYYYHEQSSNPLSTSFTCNVLPGTPLGTASNPGSPNADDLVCILDINELDLYFNNLTFNLNVPPNMCPYTVVSPYAFYVDEPGSVGAVTLTATKTNGNVTASTTSNGAVNVDANGNPVCVFDYSHNTPAGPNCCEGSYNLTTTSNPGGNITVSSGSLGGRVSNCLSGPATVSQPKDSLGNPRATIFQTYTTGTNVTYSITAPMNQTLGSNLWVANFWNPADANGAALNVYSVVGAQRAFPPNNGAALIAAHPVSLRNGVNSQIAAQPYYEWDCLTQAFDTLARIRVLVRSWDNLANWTANTNPYSANNSLFNQNFHGVQVWRDVIAGWYSYGSGTQANACADSTPLSSLPVGGCSLGVGFTRAGPVPFNAYTTGEAFNATTNPNVYPGYNGI